METLSSEGRLQDETRLFAPPWVTYPDGDDAVILVPEAPMWVRVNSAGRQLAQQCVSGRTVAEVLDSLPAEWTDSVNRVQASRAFLSQLVELGIVAEKPSKNIPYMGKRFSGVPADLERVAVHIDRSDHEAVDLAVSAVDQAGALGCREIALCFDDHVSERVQRRLIRHVLDHNVAVRVVSGDTELGPAAEMLVGKDAVVVVSVDGASDSMNDRLRKRGALASSLANLDRCDSIGVRTEVITHVCADNLESLPEIRELVTGKNAARHLISWQKVEGGIRHRRRRPAGATATAAVLRAMESGESGADIGADVKRLNHRLFFGAGEKLDLCDGALRSLAVGRDGGVYPCSWCARTKMLRLGELAAESMENIWLDSVNAAVIRQNSIQRSPNCYLCSAKYLCGGFVACVAGCAHLNREEGMEAHDIEQSCEIFRNFAVERLLALSAKLSRRVEVTSHPSIVSHMRPSPPASSTRSACTGSADGTVRTFAAGGGY